MKWYALLIGVVTSTLLGFSPTQQPHPVVRELKRLEFPEFPRAFNPSILQVGEKILCIFRYLPDPASPYESYIGAVWLDQNCTPLSKPVLLATRHPQSRTPPQAEDARLFSYRGRIFLIYNDNTEERIFRWDQRRDMHLAELQYHDGTFTLSHSLKLIPKGRSHVQQQKNWLPFTWKEQLFLTYTLVPHEILIPNLINGNCDSAYTSSTPIAWDWGWIKGSTPPIRIEESYVAFMHSGIPTTSEASGGHKLWHYYMGAYLFSATPPFEITHISPSPIRVDEFYTWSHEPKRVIFPGGCVVAGDSLYLAYGKDDCELWIARLDLEALKQSLVPCHPQ